jgi:hypothetical protein
MSKSPHRLFISISMILATTSSSLSHFIMTALRQQQRKRKRCTPPDADWECMLSELEASSAHGAITRIAARHGVNRATLSRRWNVYQRALHELDSTTQLAMLGMHDRRRNNHRALSLAAERNTIDHLLTNPAPSRADVSYTHATHSPSCSAQPATLPASIATTLPHAAPSPASYCSRS